MNKRENRKKHCFKKDEIKKKPYFNTFEDVT